MGASKLLKLAAKGGTFLKAHKTTICMCAGLVTGVGAVVECGHATVKSCKKVNEVNELRRSNGDNDLTKKEIVQLCWKNYLLTAGLTFAAIGTTAYGYGVTLKQLGVATAGAKAAETECKQLAESIEDVLGNEEHKELKDKVIDRFNERKREYIYGDSDQPIDVRDLPPAFYATGNPGIGTGPVRIKDEFGTTFIGTPDSAKLAFSKFVKDVIISQDGEASLDTFYDYIPGNVEIIPKSDRYEWKFYNIGDPDELDVRFDDDHDAFGLFWRMYYTIEPTYVG